MITFPHQCCAEFAMATKDKTDNEGYEPLVFIDTDEAVGSILIGSGLPRIIFCPWCATPIKQPE